VGCKEVGGVGVKGWKVRRSGSIDRDGKSGGKDEVNARGKRLLFPYRTNW
jgi:hypothetical protein